MSWIAIVVLIACLWLAFKAAKLVFKLLAWCLLLGALYWLCAPILGWPSIQ